MIDTPSYFRLIAQCHLSLSMRARRSWSQIQRFLSSRREFYRFGVSFLTSRTVRRRNTGKLPPAFREIYALRQYDARLITQRTTPDVEYYHQQSHTGHHHHFIESIRNAWLHESPHSFPISGRAPQIWNGSPYDTPSIVVAESLWALPPTREEYDSPVS